MTIPTVRPEGLTKFSTDQIKEDVTTEGKLGEHIESSDELSKTAQNFDATIAGSILNTLFLGDYILKNWLKTATANEL